MVLSRTEIEDKMIIVRGQMVLLDRDVADLYGVATKHINQAVKNNPDKFPDGYVLELSDEEMSQVKNFDLSSRSHYNAKVFTEKGLYMLATILKGPVATEATINIIETYSKLKRLGREIRRLHRQRMKKKGLLLKKPERLYRILRQMQWK